MKKYFLSLALGALTLPGVAWADAVIVFNEIMYHPATNEPALEWIELHNQLAVDVDVSDWTLAGGVQYRFPSNSLIRGRGFAVVAVSPSALRAVSSATNIFGPFTGRLNNNGDTLELRNNSGRVMNQISYGAEGDWPVPPDGSGVSLAKRDRNTASELAANWTSSEQAGGTPGADNFPSGFNPPPTVAFNEAPSATNTTFWLELINYGANPVPLDGYVLRLDAVVNTDSTNYAFPSGTSLAPGALLTVSDATLGVRPVVGDKFFLVASGGRVVDGIVAKRTDRARFPDGTGDYLFPTQLTPGASNRVTLRGEIVINEIMYSQALVAQPNNLPPRPTPEAWIELFNRSASPVDLTGWELGGGISYRFTPGKVLAPGAYLVVADDVDILRAAYPGIDIVGDFGGRLSGKGDRVVLRDAAGNPADEVRYFDGSPWPGYADGGGSSLELRNPDADNSKAEAWAASDESGKTTWQTYSYRATATIPSGSGQPTQWQDFILGLQEAGECLIDDLMVVENPATNSQPIISNGDFENGLAGWRVLGTHNASRVEPEPGNPGNRVLHLVASGPQEHMHNHIERTLNAGRTITGGREYQISFRARWLAGNNLLNTRLYFNRSARTTALPRATRTGTPGARNSRFETNTGPTFAGLLHQPVIPAAGAPVTVTVTAQDPNGVASCDVFWSVNGSVWSNASMTLRGGSLYQGTIPGFAGSNVVQFYVRAVDTLGIAATYPARGSNSGALYIVNDGAANLPLAHNVRIILTRANTDLLHGPSQGSNQTNVMSNDLLPCTVIYDETRAYYDCGVHLRGSQRGRYSDVRTGFHINFPADDPFRGVHPVMLIDRSGAGDAESNRQEEIVIKHILNRAGGIPGTYGEICRVLPPRNAHRGSAQFFPRHEDNFIETAFPNGGDGQMFEMELIYYPTTANASGYKNPQPDSVIGTDITNLGDDKELYRYNFMIKNHRDADDYRAFVALGKAWSLSGAALEAQTRQLMDMDEWLRAYALVALCAVGDMYTFGNNHNFFIYRRPSDGKFLYFPWDMDFAFTQGSSGPLIGDQNLGKVVTLPAYRRRLYAHMLDIMGTSYNTNYMRYWVEHYARFTLPVQNYIPNAYSVIAGRGAFVRTQINSAGGNSNFVVLATNISTANNLLTLSGSAPVSVQTIRINGSEYPVTWTSVSRWTLSVPLSAGDNGLNIDGLDLAGRIVTNRSLTVNYAGPVAPDPAGVVVINEIMYNPLLPDASYVELFNTSSNASFDLSGWRLNGVDFTFPKGSVITNRQFLVLAANMVSYVVAYGTNAGPAVGQYSGNLQNDGETLTLFRPGASPGQEIVVDKVRYESLPPWPTRPNGTGPSLQLIDARQDNSRVGNWSDGAGWRLFSVSGVAGANATNLVIFTASAGDLYIDNISLVQGTTPGVGVNVLANGGFESGQLDPWSAGGSHSNSVVSSDVAFEGTRSLHLIATGPGGLGSALQQSFAELSTNEVYTFSFWFLPSTNGTGISFRITTGLRIAAPFDYRPMPFSPGVANSSVNVLAPFPPLWVNEVQPSGSPALLDAQGEAEPWIELYNAGTSPVTLNGYYLTDNYTNLTQWAFPAGATIQPGEFKVIFADGEPNETTASQWHTSFRLNASTGSVALVWTPTSVQVLDYLHYGPVRAGYSFGDYPDGQPFDRQEFFRVTPGATNDPIAAPIVASVNEWMAANTRTLLNTNNGNRFDDWFEIYNPGSSTVSLTGHYLTDNLSNKTQFAIPPGYTIPPRGFLVVWADGRPGLNSTNDPALHVSFRLGNGGESIGLFAADGRTVDAVTFGEQFDDYSQGRFGDGAAPIYYLLRATPGAPNTSWANREPVLAPLADATLGVGQMFTFTASATDPEAPPQILTFSLGGNAPTNALIHPVTGAFAWTPVDAQAPSTNFITVRVTDSGTPGLTAARTIRVVVTRGPRVSGFSRAANGDVMFVFSAIAGKTYRVEYKNDLNDPMWTALGPDFVASGTSVPIMDNVGARPQRFYRIVQVD